MPTALTTKLITSINPNLRGMGRDDFYIPVKYRKIIIWLGFRSRIFLDITTQQNQINKYQNIEAKKRIFQTETLISNIH